MQKITLACDAMATRFELVLLGEDPVQLRAAGEEALEEIHRIEGRLSLYKGGSEIGRVNARAAFEAVRVTPGTFALIERARVLWEITGGSFDITIAPLVRCWGFMKHSGARPADGEIAKAREVVGMPLVELDAEGCTVRFRREGMMLDLGAVGKGFALDAAVEILRDAGVENALLHGGTSSIYGLGRDVAGPWRIALDEPQIPGGRGEADSSSPPRTIAIIELEDQSLSISAVWGKFFVLEGKTYGHVIDPRTGWPAQAALMGCVVSDSATDCDALSTGVLLGNHSEMEQMSRKVAGLRFLQAKWEGEEVRYLTRGIELATI